MLIFITFHVITNMTCKLIITNNITCNLLVGNYELCIS